VTAARRISVKLQPLAATEQLQLLRRADIWINKKNRGINALFESFIPDFLSQRKIPLVWIKKYT
jgi:hypothetical protein